MAYSFNQGEEIRYGGGLKLSQTNNVYSFIKPDILKSKQLIPRKLRYRKLKKTITNDNNMLLFKLQYMKNLQQQKNIKNIQFDSITGIDKQYYNN